MTEVEAHHLVKGIVNNERNLVLLQEGKMLSINEFGLQVVECRCINLGNKPGIICFDYFQQSKLDG